MALSPFSFHEPSTVAEAAQLKRTLGDNAAFYAGGTELVLVMKQGLLRYEHLIHLKSIPGLDTLHLETNRRVLRIGGLVRHARLAADPEIRDRLPVLAEMAAGIGNPRVRSLGTLGGNLAFAEPRSDPAALLLALDATIEADRGAGPRRLPAREFWIGPFSTALEPDEIVTAVEVPLLPDRTGAAYRKFAVSEFPTVGVAACVTLAADSDHIERVRLAVTAVNPYPARLTGAEEALTGIRAAELLAWTPAHWLELVRAELEPADDVYGSAEYKRHLTAVLLKDTVRAALQRASRVGDCPP